MRKNILIIGGIITAIAVFMLITGWIGCNYIYLDNRNLMQWFPSMFFIGLNLLFMGIPIVIIGVVLKKEQKETTMYRHCPNCGRSIPFDARICPYCKKDFEISIKT